jgi:hypothetical protein
MLETFRNWCTTNAVKITWFIIGAMIMSGLIYFAQGQWLNAIICFAIAGANWYFNGK